MARRLAPEVNAGSMADIAFLLLIFFLVTTTIESDYGISRRLPPKIETESKMILQERNLFEIQLNQSDEILAQGVPINVHELKAKLKAFLDNGSDTCAYCKGMRDNSMSEHPTKAVVSLVNSRETSYEMYIQVQNELLTAYDELRNREAQRLYGLSYASLLTQFRDPDQMNQKDLIASRIKVVEALFPEKVSEKEDSSVNVNL